MALERVEVGEPRVDVARAEEHVAQVLVRRGMSRLCREHVAKGRDRSGTIALLLEQHAEIEVGVDEVGLERQRTLVGAGGPLRVSRSLQRGAVVEVRQRVGRRAQQDVAVDRECGSAIAAPRVNAALHPQ